MTRKEIHEFLANTKVYVNGKSKEIQEKLFSFGWSWPGCTKTKYEGEPFLFIHEYLSLTHGCDMLDFTKNAHREISAEEILSLELTEPAYRPFKTQEECWNEMLKHEPFAFLSSANEYDWFSICRVFEEEGIPKITFASNPYSDYDMTKVFDTFQFADGTPFGIKEE